MRDLPKYLYHGTCTDYLDSICDTGIVPRKLFDSESNWDSLPSSRDMVYLTDVIPFYYALHTAEGMCSVSCVFEIDTSYLDTNLFRADEDYIAACGLYHADTVGQVQRIARKRPELWRPSIDSIGTCAYYGSIPAVAITQVVCFDHEHNPELTEYFWHSPVTFPETSMYGDSYRDTLEYIFQRIPESDADFIPEIILSASMAGITRRRIN